MRRSSRAQANKRKIGPIPSQPQQQQRHTIHAQNTVRRSSRRRKLNTDIAFETLEANEAKGIQDALKASLLTGGGEPSFSEIPEAPVYYPTPEQFCSPLLFIESIRSEAEQYGVCRIVPPKGWKHSSFAPQLLKKKTRFNTRKQSIHRLQEAHGFDDGAQYTPMQYQKQADRFFKKWFHGQNPSLADIEKEFWSVVRNSHHHVDVEYGNDIDSRAFGSGFPSSKSSYNSSWNLNEFANLPGSIIRHVNANISGVNAPWVYFGMLFSAFCWHAEDLWMYSVNYMHFGATKTWYGCPGSHLHALESVMKKQVPELFRAEPDLMLKLVTMLSPTLLLANGVPIFRTHQGPGEFVITFPKAYHAGFNNGFNCTEAVNFALTDWLGHGLDAVYEYRKYGRTGVFCFEKLLMETIERELADHILNEEEVKAMHELLGRVIEDEKRLRGVLRGKGILKARWRSLENTHNEVPLCHVCQQYCYISFVQCACRPRRYSCLAHSGRSPCRCSNHVLEPIERFSLSDLTRIRQQLL